MPTAESSRTFMVFVAVTSTGLAEALRQAASDDAIWCGSDTISEADYAKMKRPGLTRFNYSLADLELDDGAIRPSKSTTLARRPGLRLPRDHESAFGQQQTVVNVRSRVDQLSLPQVERKKLLAGRCPSKLKTHPVRSI
jgi:hypothetical protein